MRSKYISWINSNAGANTVRHKAGFAGEEKAECGQSSRQVISRPFLQRLFFPIHCTIQNALCTIYCSEVLPAPPIAADAVPSAECRPPALHDSGAWQSLTLVSRVITDVRIFWHWLQSRKKTFLNLSLTTHSHWSGAVRDFCFNDFPELGDEA